MLIYTNTQKSFNEELHFGRRIILWVYKGYKNNSKIILG